MVAALLANLFLLESPAYRVIFGLQLLFYALAAAGALWRLRPRLLVLPYYFTMINAAALVGIYQVIARRRMAWK